MLEVERHVRRIVMMMARPVFAVLVVVVAGCSSSSNHYSLRGHVLNKDIDTGLLMVSHDEIPGFMPAMTMPYRVKDPSQFGNVQAGDAITADLVVDKANKANWLEKVVITDKTGRDATPSITSDELEAGTAIPDVKLINQDGKTIHLRDFKGKAVLLTFIYTRCPFADFCPLLSHEFAAMDRELKKTPGDYERTHLLSISLDPAYDKPPVLRKYGLTYVQDDPPGFKHWDFVATSPEDLKQLAAAFNLTYIEKGNVITHNLRTVLIGIDGSVEEVWSGNEWRKQEIAEAMRAAAAGQ
jgi:protein SCO1/2